MRFARLVLCVLTVVASGDAQAARGDHKKSIEAAARRYFEVWNTHDVSALQELLAPQATLRDWDIEKTGANEVARANGGIFAAVPGIKIEVLKIHVSPSTSSVACEILVKLNNEKNEILKVVDIISFDHENKITAVRAYKG